jgi:hypothetical protein
MAAEGRAMTTKAICADCGVDTIAIGDFYMVKDDIWRRARSIRRGKYEIPGQQFLCIGCLEDRLGYTAAGRIKRCSIEAEANAALKPKSAA